MSQRTSAVAVASGPPTGGRRRRVLAGFTAAAVAATAGVLTAAPASAAVPAFPDNITVFPDRDFVSIDGFAANAGKQITVEVVRGGTVIGSATGTEAAADVINAGNPAIEVNHPGGICWGAGGGINATPDILPGDQVVVKLGAAAAAAAADTTTLSPKVTGHTLDAAGTKLTVTGTFGPDVDPAFLEQRIINPDLKNTDVNFRDVRAVPGPPTADRRSPAAYSSGLDVDTALHTFTATYQFANAATAKLADAGAMRSMSWQTLDANANRQGVTIQEDGETGGPGFGGCPAAAAAQGPAAPTAVTAVDNGDSTTTVTWTKPAAIAGGAPIIGYTVRAVAQTATAGSIQAEVGQRIGDVNATSATLPTALAGKTVEVRSVTAGGESWPPAIANKNTTGAGTTADTTAPTVTAAPPGGTFTADVSVTLTSSEPGPICYTTDGSDPLVVADCSLSSTNYKGPIAIAANTATPVTLRYVAFDNAGNPSLARIETYTFGTATAPGAPTNVTARAGDTTADVSWTAPAVTVGSPVTGYKITATAAGAPTVTGTATSLATSTTLTGLTNGTTYSVSVVATSANGDGPAGAPVTVTPAVAPAAAATVTISKVTWKAGAELRVQGSSSAATGTVNVYPAKLDPATNKLVADTAKAPLVQNAALTSAAPAAGGTFDARSGTKFAARPATQIVVKLNTAAGNGAESAAVAVP